MKRIPKIIAMLVMMMNLSLLTSWAANNRTIEIAIIASSDIVQFQKQQDYIGPHMVGKKKEPQSKDLRATIASFGDTLCHKTVDNAVYNPETGIYDFSPMFKYIEKYFETPTVVIGNCESPMAGAEMGYTGYPTFNAPEHLAVDLQELGVDIMSTANNHSLDKGFSGLESTLNFLDNAGVEHVGTARSEEEQNSILFEDLNGIKAAFLSYTYGTNGIPMPKDKQFCVNFINEELMLKQIEQAKSEGAECTEPKKLDIF